MGDHSFTQEQADAMMAAQHHKTKRDSFIRDLAEFLVVDSGKKSIYLEMNSPLAKDWQRLRNSAGIFGYPDFQEALIDLRRLLLGGPSNHPAPTTDADTCEKIGGQHATL